ncbi:MAG: FAD-containing oxidoreductase [candidate division Zixibacteria bacterium]|nr:FAD-containing oxidoreductase [candidate division Zixibacteria bacterium]
MSKNYDAIIIGTGQGGVPLAVDLANAGWKTAVIEKAHPGGSCINFGCTPTKTMLASARVAYLAKRGLDFGVETGDVRVDLKKVRDRKRQIVSSFRSGIEKRLEHDNIDLIRGQAEFISSNETKVLNADGETLISGKKIFINTGTRPSVPPIEGIDGVGPLDSEAIMELDSLPEHLVIIGGGYIGCEFGQMFRRFGSRVTIIHRDDALLNREDPDISEEVAKVFKQDGIEVLFNTEARSLIKNESGKILMTVRTEMGEKALEASHLMLAAGRTPNTDMLNLKAAGVKSDKRGFIPVNDHLETSVDGIYCIGDVKGGPAFTHISYDDYRVLKENLLNDGNSSIERRLVPYVVFIDPQLGRVGMNETEAKAANLNYEDAKMPMKKAARALEMDETRGLMKAIVDADSGRILGCTILGVEGGEIMNVLQMAMLGDVPYTKIRDTAIAHPTLGESLNNLFMTI